MNHYEILEVSRNASPEVIRAAYKSLMQHYHPDRNPGDAAHAERATLIRQAYEVLSDPARRAAYDLELQGLVNHPTRAGTRTSPRPPNTAPPEQRSFAAFYLRLVFAVIAILTIMLVWKSYNRPPAEPVQQDTSPLAGNEDRQMKPAGDAIRDTDEAPQQTIQKDKTEDASTAADAAADKELAARTLKGYIKDLKVRLHESGSGSPDTVASHKLTIPRLTVVVGEFDADKYIDYISNNEDIIRMKLANMLKDADYEQLADPDRNTDYLKELILDAMGQITSTDRFREYPAADVRDPAHYGTVDVSFPEGFTVD